MLLKHTAVIHGTGNLTVTRTEKDNARDSDSLQCLTETRSYSYNELQQC